ncbi:MAG: CPBP family intramembrane metalloprotease [Clostridia bacterium]|nr:CPBP family intramembrane metalloprotease [Clostridia bacterium]
MAKNSSEQINTVGRGLGSSSAGIAYSAAVAGYLVFSLIVSIIVVAAGLTSADDAYIYISYLAAPLGIIISQPVCAKYRNTGFKNLFPVKTKAKYYLVALLLAFGLLFSVSWANTAVLKFLQLFGYEAKDSYLPDISGWLVLPAIIVIAVIPAVCEEGLFRGVLLNNMEKEAGSVNTILIIGFAFALFHASAEQTVYQFICGCALALLAVKSRSILPSMLVHFLNNAVIIIMAACGMDVSGSLFDLAPLWAAILITVLSAISFIAAAVILILDKEQLYPAQKGGVKKFFIGAAIGIVILAVLWIAGLF